MEVDEDLHVCLTCHVTISGLENYIHHKKNVCNAARKAQSVVHILPVPGLDDESRLKATPHFDVPSAAPFHDTVQQASSQPTELGTIQSLVSKIPDSSDASFKSATEAVVPSQDLFAGGEPAPAVEDVQDSSRVIKTERQPKSVRQRNTSGRRKKKSVKKEPLSDDPSTDTGKDACEVTETPTSSHVETENVFNTSSEGAHQGGESEENMGEMEDAPLVGDSMDPLQEVSESDMANLVESLSPNVNRTIDANMMLYTNVPKDPAFSSVSDFFSSLELQAKWNFCRSDKDEEDRLDHQRALRIANILNELAFSSDSEDFFPANAENLLDMDDEVFDVAIKQEPVAKDTVQRSSPRQAGARGRGRGKLPPGGKWKPGKLETSGTWKPSRKLAAMKATTQVTTRRTLRSRGKVPPSDEAWGGAEYESDEDAEVDMGDAGTQDNHSMSETAGKTLHNLSQTGGKKMNVTVDSGGQEIIATRICGAKSGKATGDPDLDRVLEIAVKVEKDEDFQTDSDIDRSRNEVELEPSESHGYDLEDGSSFEKFADECQQPDGTYHCPSCNRTIKSSRVGFERHCVTTYHKKREGMRKFGMKVDKMRSYEMEPVECRICHKFFNYKYNFARHLASEAHLSQARNCKSELLLDESVQVLLLRQSRFQCLVCSFFTSQFEFFQQHMTSENHREKVGSLTGPLFCVRCRYACRSNDGMLSHLSSDDHRKVVENSKRPLIIKESRTRVKCEKCEQVLHSASVLIKHMKACHPEDGPGRTVRKKGVRTKPVCPYCRKSWPSTFALTVHIRRVHTRERPFKCACCSKEFVDKHSLKVHSESTGHVNQLIRASQQGKGSGLALASTKRQRNPFSLKPLFKCKHCDTCVNRYTDLREHYLTEHASKMIRCEPCGLSFHSMTLYNDHTLRKGHKMRTDFIQKRVKTYPCLICGRVFNNTKKKELHELSHRVVLTESAGRKLVGDPFFGIHERYHEFLRSIQTVPYSERVTCPECKKKMCRSNIYPHMRSHDGEAPYKCIICSKRFYNSSSLRHHMEVHLGLKEFKCSFCPKAFYRKHRLRDHVLTSHTPNAEKKWMCQKCGMAFTSKNTASAHERGHDRKYKCPYEKCRFAFRSRLDLESHIRTHTNERPFLCDQCGYAAKTKRQLGYHRKRHTGERNHHCDYCEYRATTKAHLQRHMRIHCGVKPYKCPYCDFACNTLDNLTKHILKTKRHAGLPVYPCKNCAFGANTGKEFREHLYEVHGIEDRDVGVLAKYMGIYKENLDAKVLPEGALVIPIKERKPRIKKEGDESYSPPVPKKKKQKTVMETPPPRPHENMLEIPHNPHISTGVPPVGDDVAEIKIDFGNGEEQQLYYRVQKQEEVPNSGGGTVTIWAPEEMATEGISSQPVHELGSPVAQHVEIADHTQFKQENHVTHPQVIEHVSASLPHVPHSVDNQVISHTLMPHVSQSVSHHTEAEVEESRQNVEQFIGLVEQTFGQQKVGEVVQSAVWSQHDQQMYVVCGQQVDQLETMAGPSDHVYHTIEVDGTTDVQVVEVAISATM